MKAMLWATFLDHIPFVGFWHLTDRGETWLPALPYGSVSISFSWASFTTSVEERQGGCQTFWYHTPWGACSLPLGGVFGTCLGPDPTNNHAQQQTAQQLIMIFC